MSKEAFKLSASSALAGKYIPEIIDNLNSAGIEYVELDYIQGVPAHLLSEVKFTAAARELADNNIKISGLRLPGMPAELSSIVARLNAAGINRIMMPIDANPGKLAKTIPAHIKLSLYNAAVSGKCAAAAMQQLYAEKIYHCFTFNAANFAACGEKPFLVTYREGKFVKYIDQLDIADAAFNGMPSGLARGNAELKELISILRCRRFKGFMTLSASNRPVGNLSHAAAAFKQMLNEI
jgi:sugar phosphate isomerase/epimerase